MSTAADDLSGDEPPTPRPAALQRDMVVPSDVSRRKLQRELDTWQANCAMHWQRERAVIVGIDDLLVDVAFAVPLDGISLGLPGPSASAVIPFAIRLEFTNYDLEPPSLTFIHPFTKTPAAPIVPFREVVDGVERSILLAEHPITGLPFICRPGMAEYHLHPEHRNESWLAEHRDRGVGRLANVVEAVWRAATEHASVRVAQVALLAMQLELRPLPGTTQALAIDPAAPAAAADAGGDVPKATC